MVETLELRRLLAGYSVVELGVPPGGSRFGNAINDSGVIAGTDRLADNSHIAMIRSGTQITHTGLGGAFAEALGINASGQVVGRSTTSAGFPTRAFLWSGGQMTQLPNGFGGTESGANAINDAGVIVGSALDTAGVRHPFAYQNGQMTNLGSLGGSDGVANSINATGQIVGASSTGSVTHAFTYSAGQMHSLGSLGHTSVALDINDDGIVVGHSFVQAGIANQRGFIWDVDDGMRALPTLGGRTTARAINDDGVVVGFSNDAQDQSKAFTYRDGQITDLNTFLPAGSNIRLMDAFDVNDAGQIIVHGTVLGQSGSRTFLLTPMSPPLVTVAGPAAGDEGSAMSFTATANDPDGNSQPFLYQWSVTRDGASVALPGNVTTNAAGFTFSPTDNGDYVVHVTVTDDDGETGTASSPVTFASAGLGTTGVLSGRQVHATTFIANRFEVTSTFTTTEVGAHMAGLDSGGGAGVFAAIVRLTGPTDFPDSTNLSTSDVVGHATITPPSGGSADVAAPLSVTLAPGWYAIVIGAGLFGTSGSAMLPANNTPAPGASTFYFTSFNGQYLNDASLTSSRLFVNGTREGKPLRVNNVAPAPTVLAPPTGSEGTAIHVPSQVIEPAAADVLSYSWVVTKDGQPYFTSSGPSFITLTPNDNGVYNVTLTVEDDDGGAGTNSRSIAVSNVAPTVPITGAGSVAEGSVYSLTLGQVSDPGMDAPHAFLVDWGDGTGFAHIPVANLGLNRTVTHVFPDGPLMATVTVRVADEDGTHVAATKVVEVENASPALVLTGASSVPEAFPYHLTLGPITDAGVDTVAAYLIDWGGGAQQTVIASDLPPDRMLTHFYIDGPRTQLVQVTVIDEDGSHHVATKPLFVHNVPPVAIIHGPSHLVPHEPGTFYFRATDPSPVDQGERIEYRIDWGDGSPERVIIAGSGDLTPGLPHTFASTGNFTVRVTAKDQDGGTGSHTLYPVAVTATRLLSDGRLLVGGDGRVEVVPGSVRVLLNGVEVAHLPDEDVNGLEVFAGPGDDEIIVDPAITLPATLSGGDGNDAIRAGGGDSVLVGGAGDDTLYGGPGLSTIVATEGGGSNTYVSGGGAVVVEGGSGVTTPQFAPTIGTINATVGPMAVNNVMTFTAPYEDLDLALPVGETLSASWEWGDGNTTQGAVAAAVTGTHAYSAAGVYTVNLTLTDSTGASATANYRYAVVYDPSAGFVTGGGWINSPAGAMPASPAASGKATFGFVAKYHQGASAPSGVTEFSFRMGDLNFRSTSYDWLVVGGARAQFKGRGAVNGQGDFGFLLSAVDGQRPGGGGSDKFRIKIWSRATGTIVYDNQLGDDDDAPAATALGGGNIVLHTT